MNQTSSRKLDPYLQLIGGLYLILQKICKEGLMYIENVVENPRESGEFSILGNYDIANEPVYLFACDALRLMATGNLNANELGQYMFSYRRTTEFNDEQKCMSEVARLTLLASLQGYSPADSIEFGRQGIPAVIKPSFSEMKKFIAEITARPKASLDVRLGSFFDSIGAP